MARLCGDEFILILYHCSLDQAKTVVQTLHQAVQSFRFDWDDKVYSCSLSIGLVEINGNFDSSCSIMGAASSACQKAKNSGRNRSYFYQSTDQEAIARRGAIEWLPRIIKALETDQFVLYSQPIVPVKGSYQSQAPFCIYSQEILLRLRDEQGNLVAPGDFIPIAERYGLMHLVDRWVIRNLFKWIVLHFLPFYEPQETNTRFLYTVNLSGASLNDDQFLEYVQEQITLYNIPSGLICFEITETLAVSNLMKTSQLIKQLKALGCCFALDDFGSGMSSFGYLMRLPVDYLKIDGIFVKDLDSCQVANEIVVSINRVTHVMGIQTIAEFVENEAIFDRLNEIGIDFAQGYCIARPAPLDDFIPQ